MDGLGVEVVVCVMVDVEVGVLTTVLVKVGVIVLDGEVIGVFVAVIKISSVKDGDAVGVLFPITPLSLTAPYPRQ
ncbi:MAG: hypothetical protein ACK2TS_02715 [Anaerolineales bacterium]